MLKVIYHLMNGLNNLKRNKIMVIAILFVGAIFLLISGFKKDE